MCSNTYLACLHLSKGFLETDAAGVNRCCYPVFSGKYFYLESLLILIILWQVICLDRFISNIFEDQKLFRPSCEQYYSQFLAKCCFIVTCSGHSFGKGTCSVVKPSVQVDRTDVFSLTSSCNQRSVYRAACWRDWENTEIEVYFFPVPLCSATAQAAPQLIVFDEISQEFTRKGTLRYKRLITHNSCV